MKFKEPKNPNYAALIVKVDKLVPLAGLDKVQGAIILGNQVIVDISVKAGDIGIYFPLECQLSNVYLSANNMYSNAEHNADKTIKGYFKENGRIRCIKFKDHKSEGLFMPIESVTKLVSSSENLHFVVGDTFDEIMGIEVCRKYIVKNYVESDKISSSRQGKSNKKESRIATGQFKFHADTQMMFRNLHKFHPDSVLSITYKLHGTSGISSYLLCNKKLKWYENILLALGVDLEINEYDYVYSSRKVIKSEVPSNPGYYKEDIWKLAHEQVQSALQKGMTFYYEIIGHLPSGKAIQGKYDYSCAKDEFVVAIYRITQTNVDGKVTEYSAKQVQEFCKKNGLNAVPELYYGKARDFYWDARVNYQTWLTRLLEKIKEAYNEKDCFLCVNKVPEEGCVVRIDGLDFNAFKVKSNRFYELETKQLDKGEVNIEEEN